MRTHAPLGVLAALALWSSAASAHISLEQAGTHLSRYGDGNLKDAPCGMAGGGRGANVYTYAPGETIRIALSEFIPHPSYFRVAFDDDGDDDFVEPASIQPIDPLRPCPFNAADQCGTADFYNTPAVLPGMDNLEPHVSAAFGAMYTFDVTLPDVECENCTLQIIQVMEDTVHGAYNPAPGHPADIPYVADIYHQCIDLVLTRGSAPPPVMPPVGGSGGVGGAAAGGAAAGGAAPVPPPTATGGAGMVPTGTGAEPWMPPPAAGGGGPGGGAGTSSSEEPLASDAAGCSCRAAGARQRDGGLGGALLALAAAALAGTRRRCRRVRRQRARVEPPAPRRS